jgi:hypothetical protein
MNTAFIGFAAREKPLDDAGAVAINMGSTNLKSSPVSTTAGRRRMADVATPPRVVEGCLEDWLLQPQQSQAPVDEAGWTQRAVGQTREGRTALSILFMYQGRRTSRPLTSAAQLSGIGVEAQPQRLEWTAFLAALRATRHVLDQRTLRPPTSVLLLPRKQRRLRTGLTGPILRPIACSS